jgi:hypothetical protein
MKMKKLAIASAVAMMFVGSAHAIDLNISTTSTEGLVTTVTESLPTPTDTMTTVSAALGTLLDVTTPTISVMGGAINTALINGAIDISGTNVTLGALSSTVSATANVNIDTGTADAFAIAGAKLSTTVIGAMNSSTLDVMASTTNLGSSATSGLDIGSLAGSGAIALGTPAVGGTGVTGLDANLAATAVALTSSADMSLSGFSSLNVNDMTSSVNELQAMNVFNGAINVAALDAGIKIAATPDSGAWFLNPQTGIVSLSNISMATTAIGAMNSSITRLGANLAAVATVTP